MNQNDGQNKLGNNNPNQGVPNNQNGSSFNVPKHDAPHAAHSKGSFQDSLSKKPTKLDDEGPRATFDKAKEVAKNKIIDAIPGGRQAKKLMEVRNKTNNVLQNIRANKGPQLPPKRENIEISNENKRGNKSSLDNNNDNNSDIVQLNNLYRNNITAKIICNIIVITQYDAIAEAVKTKEIQVLYNPHPEDGISSSVKIGLNASLDADAVLFTVSDQPWLTSETICELIHVFLNTSKGIACVSCQGKMGNPCIFDRKYYNELLSLEGDKGGKKVIMKHLDDTQIYEIEAGRELEDIDYYESIAVH